MSFKNYFKNGLTAMTMLGALVIAPSSIALTTYNQDFETMTPLQGYPPNDLSLDGWQIYGIAWDTNPYTGPANIVYEYGPFRAANGDPGSIQGVATGQGGPDQGNLVLSKYTDYNNPDHTVVPFTPGMPKYYISASTFQTQTIAAGDAGLWRFTYDAKIGNLMADSSAFAYILTQDSPTGLGKAFVFNDTTNLPIEWGTYSLDFLVDDTMIGDILSFGFSATATNYNGSAVFYDNINFALVPLPAAVWLFGSGLLGLIGIAIRKKAA